MLPLAASVVDARSLASPVRIREDNKACIDVFRSGATKGLAWLAAKAVNIRASCVHDLVELGIAVVLPIGTHFKLGDSATKALQRVKLESARTALGLRQPPVSTGSSNRITPL